MGCYIHFPLYLKIKQAPIESWEKVLLCSSNTFRRLNPLLGKETGGLEFRENFCVWEVVWSCECLRDVKSHSFSRWLLFGFNLISHIPLCIRRSLSNTSTSVLCTFSGPVLKQQARTQIGIKDLTRILGPDRVACRVLLLRRIERGTVTQLWKWCALPGSPGRAGAGTLVAEQT